MKYICKMMCEETLQFLELNLASASVSLGMSLLVSGNLQGTHLL